MVGSTRLLGVLYSVVAIDHGQMRLMHT